MVNLVLPANGDPDWGIVNSAALTALNAGKAEASMVGLKPTVAPAASPDIFGAPGATIDYSGTAVTTTSIAACSAEQVGSVKRIIPAADATFTASASMKIDGNTSGDYTLLAGVAVMVLATSINTFEIIRPLEYTKPTDWTATLTCATPGNLSISSVTQNCKYSVAGDVATIVLNWQGTVTHTTASGIFRITGLPASIAPPSMHMVGSAMIGGISSGAGWTQYGVQMNGDSDIYFVRTGNGQTTTNCDISDIVSGASVSLRCVFQILLTPN